MEAQEAHLARARGLPSGPVRSTLSTGLPAGTRKKKRCTWFRPTIPVFVTEKPLATVNSSGTMTVFIVA